MSRSRYQVLSGQLAAHPEDPGAWLELARWARRVERVPPFLTSAHLPFLLAAWRLAPRDRSLLPLFLKAADSTLEDWKSPTRSSWWESRSQSSELPGDCFARGIGPPLRVRHLRTGQELCLIPGRVSAREPLGKTQTNPERRWLGSYLGRFPVSVKDYDRFLRATGHRLPTDHREKTPWDLQLREPDRPVVFVSQLDALAYCRWAGGELPENSLWTMAARGPGTRPFPWGDTPPEAIHANFNHGRPWRGGDWDRFLKPTGAHPDGASPFGIEDLAGQVREWTREEVRVRDQWKARVRGGSWGSSRSEQLRILHPDDFLELPRRLDDVGFRLAIPLFQALLERPDRLQESPSRPPRRDRLRRKKRKRRRRTPHPR